MDTEDDLIDRIRKANLNKANKRREAIKTKKVGGKIMEAITDDEVILPTVPDFRKEKKQEEGEAEARVLHKAEKQMKREEDAQIRIALADENKILRKQLKKDKRDEEQGDLLERLKKVEGAQRDTSLAQSSRYGGTHGRQMVYHRACDLVARNSHN